MRQQNERTELRLEDMALVSMARFIKGVGLTSNNKDSAISKLVDHPDVRTEDDVRLIDWHNHEIRLTGMSRRMVPF